MAAFGSSFGHCSPYQSISRRFCRWKKLKKQFKEDIRLRGIVLGHQDKGLADWRARPVPPKPDTVDSLKKGDADIHGAIYYSEDRSEWMAFSQPVYEFSLCFFFSKKHGEVLKISQLDGQKIGVIGSSYQEEKLRKHYPFSKRTGIDFEAVHAQLSELPELIQTRRTDMFPAYMNLEPNRFMDLTDSCFTLSWVIVNRMDAPFLKDVKDLAGMKVSMVENIPIYEQLQCFQVRLSDKPALFWGWRV
jgi:hypothetical protein